MKKQIWLENDQIELVYMCLVLVSSDLTSTVGGSTTKMAANYTNNRIKEIIPLFKAKL